MATWASLTQYWLGWLLAVSGGCHFRCHVPRERANTLTPWPCGSVSQFKETLEITWGLLVPFFCPG